jgi:glutamine synthetase
LRFKKSEESTFKLGDFCFVGIVKKAQGVGAIEAKAKAYRDSVFKAQVDLRADIDALETILPSDLWPVPTYAEMLFKL